MLRQRQHLPKARAELLRDGRKIGHYAWWLLPCDHAGGSEPAPATYVTHAAAPHLLARGDDDGWLGSLEALASCGARRDDGLRGVLPTADFPSLFRFLEF